MDVRNEPNVPTETTTLANLNQPARPLRRRGAGSRSAPAPRTAIEKEVQGRGQGAVLYLPFPNAVAMLCDGLEAIVEPDLSRRRERVESEGPTPHVEKRDLLEAEVMKTMLASLSSCELVAYVDLRPGMKQIAAAFWSVGFCRLIGAAELRLLGARGLTMSNWALRMGASDAGYPDVVPSLNELDLKRWIAEWKKRVGVHPPARRHKVIVKEIIALCRAGDGRLFRSDVMRIIEAEIGGKITDHCWKSAHRAACEKEPKVRMRFAAGRPRKKIG